MDGAPATCLTSRCAMWPSCLSSCISQRRSTKRRACQGPDQHCEVQLATVLLRIQREMDKNQAEVTILREVPAHLSAKKSSGKELPGLCHGHPLFKDPRQLVTPKYSPNVVGALC